MRSYRKKETFAPLGQKAFWHPYSLQSLQPEKFISVANSILRGKSRILLHERGAK
jgi:hypothetical protein